MTPRWLGIALLCVGAVNALEGIMLVFRSTSSNNALAYSIASCGVGVMICGYFIGKRKRWK